MEQTGIQQTVNQLRAWMTTTGYSKGTLLQFESTVNQLLNFMDSTGTSEYTTDVGMQFLRERYAFMLIARLGLRSGDVANLKYENIDWENMREEYGRVFRSEHLAHTGINPQSDSRFERIILEFYKSGFSLFYGNLLGIRV